MNKKGFTLIEIAIVLVVIGILVSIGAGLVGTLAKKEKLVDSRDRVKTAKEALSGYAVKSGFLPTTIALTGARELDAWGRALQYAAATGLTGSGNACGLTATDRTIFECTNAACSTSNTKSNVAFIVWSIGEDANGLGTTTQPTAGPACPLGQTCYWIRQQGTTDASYTLEYDDIVQYATLDEIRTGMACTGVTTTIPNPPTLVTATRVTPSGLNLTWTAPTTNTDLTPLIDFAGYDIDRSTDGITYSLYQSIGIGTSFSDTNLSAGRRYFYMMRSKDKDGNQSVNSAVTSTTISPVTQTGAIATYTAATLLNCGYALAGTPAVQFSILNRGVAGDVGANISITSMTISWTGVAGGIRAVDFTPGTAPYNWSSPTPVASPATVTFAVPVVINAGLTSAVRLCFSTSPRAVTNNYNITINTADGQFGVY